MNLVLFTFVVVLCIVIYSILSRNILNAFTLLTVPYLLIILVNNMYMYKKGFYLVEDNTMLFLFVSFFAFWIGGLVTLILKNFVVGKAKRYSIKSIKYDYPKMFKYALFVIMLMLIKLILAIKSNGLSYIGSEEFSGYLLKGITGKLMITCYPIAPMILFAWFENKRKINYLMTFLLIVMFTFLTFIKYHIISLIIITFVYLFFKQRKYANQSFWIFVIGIPAAFILNYIVSFKVRGMVVDSSFYLQHLWNYVGGSLINDNNILDYNFRSETSIFYNLGMFMFPLLNMILSPLGITLPHLIILPFFQIGNTSQMVTNVIDQFTSLYNSPDFSGKIFFFLLILIILGIFSELFVGKLNNPKNDGSLLFASCYANFFLVLGFFGAFYTQPLAWIWMIFSWLVPKVFEKKVIK